MATVAVLDDVELTMAAGEFVAFLGPSGCGKSTLLRIIAGLETLDAGEVRLEGRRIDRLPPGQRGVAMVFQHYALYPQMRCARTWPSACSNVGVAAGRDRDADRDRRRVARDRAAARPQAGAAVGRPAPARRDRPRDRQGSRELFLLDEPLSNLDAALRTRTRVELAQLRQRVDAALIMVTHDQAEAMTLADRIVVMNDRRIQQVGPPMEIYRRPANAFVARFVGSPAMTLLPATPVGGDGDFARVRLGDGGEVATRVRAPGLRGGALRLGLRPEHVRVTAPGQGAAATAILVERLGDRTLVYARLGDGQEVTASPTPQSPVRIGDAVGLAIDGGAAHLFDRRRDRPPRGRRMKARLRGLRLRRAVPAAVTPG